MAEPRFAQEQSLGFHKVHNAIDALDLGHFQKAVLHHLARRHNTELGYAFPSQNTIARAIGKHDESSLQSVSRAVKTLSKTTHADGDPLLTVKRTLQGNRYIIHTSMRYDTESFPTTKPNTTQSARKRHPVGMEDDNQSVTNTPESRPIDLDTNLQNKTTDLTRQAGASSQVIFVRNKVVMARDELKTEYSEELISLAEELVRLKASTIEVVNLDSFVAAGMKSWGITQAIVDKDRACVMAAKVEQASYAPSIVDSATPGTPEYYTMLMKKHEVASAGWIDPNIHTGAGYGGAVPDGIPKSHKDLMKSLYAKDAE